MLYTKKFATHVLSPSCILPTHKAMNKMQSRVQPRKNAWRGGGALSATQMQIIAMM